MKAQLIFGFVIAMSIPGAYGNSIGVAVNGTCAGGSCPAVELAIGSTDTLSVDFTETLPDGDIYLMDGSFTGSNTADGVFSTGHQFQVTYEGNAAGGASLADTIIVEAYYAFQATVDTTTFDRDLIGAFGPTIAASSSASSCVNEVEGCLGPATPPGSFSLTTSFSLDNTSSSFVYDPAFTNNFGAGSAVGSYTVWGQTTALPPPPVPEPASFVLLAFGLAGIFFGRGSRRTRP